MVRLQRKTFRAACLPLLICNWITGTAIIEHPIGRQRKILSDAIAIVSLLVHATIVYLSYVSSIFKNSNDNSFNKIGSRIMNFVNTALSLYSGILSFRHRKAPERFIASMQRIDDTLAKFGIVENYRALYISNICEILLMLVVVEILNAVNVQVLLMQDASVTAILLGVLLTHHMVLFTYISDLTIKITIKYVGKKFQQLNDLLESHANKELYATDAERRQAYDRLTSSKIHRVIKAAKEIHLDLTRISQRISVVYGLRLLLSVSINFIVITWTLYYTSIEISQQKINLSHISDPNVQQLIVWFLFYTKKIMMIIRPCAETRKEARKTCDIIYRLGDTSRDHMIRKEVQDFFLQTTQHPVVFSAYGFFDLDYTLIQTIIGSVTTYLVILIQVDDIEPTADNGMPSESMIRALNISI